MKYVIFAVILFATACTSISRDTASETHRKQPLPSERRAD